MTPDIHFSANNFHFTITTYGEEWVWTAYDDEDHSNELDDNGYFDTAAEAQQDALAYASRHADDLREGEEYETRADLRRELSPRVL